VRARTRPERAPRRLPRVSPERRAAILELPVSAVTHATLLAELPFARALEATPPPAPLPAARSALRASPASRRGKRASSAQSRRYSCTSLTESQ